LTKDDGADKERQRARIGNLAGAIVEIRVGGAIPSAQAEVKQRIESALAAGRAAWREGCLLGGGAALLAAAL